MKSRLFAFSLALIAVMLMSVVGGSTNATALQGTAQPTLPALTKKFKIAVVMPSAKNDLAWSQTITSAADAVQAEFGKDKVDLTYSENLYKVEDAVAAMRDYASQGYDLIIAHGTQYGDQMFEVAADFPDVSFAWGTATDTGTAKGLKNIFAYEAQAEEGGYVEGVIASMMTKSGVIGVVGPVNAGDAQLYIDGFKAGALSTGKVKDVKVIFTDSFGDTAKATEAAKTLIGQGADVLTGSAQQVPGAIGEIQKAKGYWFGTQSDQIGTWADTVVASQVYDWKPMLEDIITSRVAGVKGGKAYEISLKNGGLKIVYNDKIKLPDDVKKAAADTVAAIISGKIIAPDSPAAATPAATMAATAAK